jgi:3-deoxy-7-phosphoheptulonate synthase
VAADVAAQVAGGDRRLVGVMVESFFERGRQDLVPGTPLKPGVSITDACLDWPATEELLEGLAQAARTRRTKI